MNRRLGVAFIRIALAATFVVSTIAVPSAEAVVAKKKTAAPAKLKFQLPASVKASAAAEAKAAAKPKTIPKLTVKLDLDKDWQPSKPTSKPAATKPAAKPVATKPKPAAKPAAPKPAPKPVVKPKPAPKPAPKPVAKPKPAPKPAPKPVAKPKPVVKPKPAPKQAPKPVAKPKPAPKPAPRPVAKPKPAPKPAPRPVAKPQPRPPARPVARPRVLPKPRIVNNWFTGRMEATGPCMICITPTRPQTSVLQPIPRPGFSVAPQTVDGRNRQQWMEFWGLFKTQQQRPKKRYLHYGRYTTAYTRESLGKLNDVSWKNVMQPRAQKGRRKRGGNVSKGMCYQAVKETLIEAGITKDYIPGEPASGAARYMNAEKFPNGAPMFVNIAKELNYDATKTPPGSIIVYKGGRFGHVELKIKNQYCSDHCNAVPMDQKISRKVIAIFLPLAQPGT